MTYFVLFAIAAFTGWYLNYRSDKFPTAGNFHLWLNGVVGMIISAIGFVVTMVLDFIKKLYGH
jgi:hypothetical protein